MKHKPLPNVIETIKFKYEDDLKHRQEAMGKYMKTKQNIDVFNPYQYDNVVSNEGNVKFKTKVKKQKVIVPSEHEEALLLKDYLDVLWRQKKVVCYSHIANETFTKSWSTKMKNKQEGVHAGIPDYIIVLPHTVLFIELKREKGGVVSPEQETWIEALNARVGIHAKVCKGFDQSKEFIEEFI